MYSNETSLTKTYNGEAVQALLKGEEGTEDNTRLAKAANAAGTLIDSYLRRGGYKLPLLYTEYGQEVPVEGPPPLDALLQQIADCLTAYNLAVSGDLMTQAYERCRADSLTMLEQIANGKLPLDLLKEDQKYGIAVLSRPRVYTKSAPTPQDVFTSNI